MVVGDHGNWWLVMMAKWWMVMMAKWWFNLVIE